MRKLDTWRSAQAVINKHDDDATIHDDFRSYECPEKGDLDGAAVWSRVIQVIEELQDTVPGTLH